MVETPVSPPTDSVGAVESPPLAPSQVPLCFVVDEEPSIRHFLSLVLHGAGLDAMEFADGESMRAAMANHSPALVFHNISLESSDAIASVVALGKLEYRGAIQLMSNRGAAVLEHVKSIGVQHKLNMLPVLKKPFETEAVVKILESLNLGGTTKSGIHIDLDEALSQKWVEFWYQPKIDLRRKRLAGAETYARVRHPQHGVLLPASFMPGAKEESLTKLSEQALVSALKAGHTFYSSIGINLPIAVNIPVPALIKLPIEDIVKMHRPNAQGKWPGLIIDVPEEQIITDLTLANELSRKLERINVRLAIDDFGRGHSSLARVGELPFAELKIDRAFVIGCGTDRTNAPLCKTVIDLAHNFGRTSVAMGIEKAADAIALVSMGCDFGQGFLLGQPMSEDRFISLLRQRAATQGKSLAPTPR
jgi:EAL domain-containing protein (putative c-di-GMP-specific phosphodiesterase class I)